MEIRQREVVDDMSDGPSADDFRAKVFRDREHRGDWRVEKLNDNGGSIEVAIFSGEDRQRALRYADREYGAFDEIEQERNRRRSDQLERRRPVWSGEARQLPSPCTPLAQLCR